MAIMLEEMKVGKIRGKICRCEVLHCWSRLLMRAYSYRPPDAIRKDNQHNSSATIPAFPEPSLLSFAFLSRDLSSEQQ